MNQDFSLFPEKGNFPFYCLILLFLIYLSSGVAFIYKMPPFENSDELGHLGYIYHIIRSGRLPHVVLEQASLFKQEGYQSPLYYLSCVPVASWSGFGFDPTEPRLNPNFKFSPGFPGLGEHRLYKPIDNDSPQSLQEMGRACIRLRWISLLWGLIAGIFGAKLLWSLSKESSPITLTGVSLFMLNPRWIETCTSVSNDVAATAMGTLIILLLTKMVIEERCLSPLWILLLSLASFAAVMSKVSCLAFVPVASLFLFLGSGKAVSFRHKFFFNMLFLVLVLLFISPWLYRNYQLYGSFLAQSPRLVWPYVAIRKVPLDPIAFFAQEFQGFRWSYWAVYGQFAVLAHPWVYPLLDGFLLLGSILAGGFAFQLQKKNRLPPLRIIGLLPAASIMVFFMSFLSYTAIFMASQGRLLFPVGFCVAFYLSGGWLFLGGKKTQWLLSALISLVMAAFALYVPFFVLAKAYGT